MFPKVGVVSEKELYLSLSNSGLTDFFAAELLRAFNELLCT